MGKQWKQWESLIFLGSRITTDGDCSHEIKRCLLPGRKAMTNIDSILKSPDFTLQTKVHLVKAMLFPVVMYGCESWSIKKTVCQRIDAFELWLLEKILESPLDWKDIQPVYSKGDQSWMFIGRTDAEPETPILFGHLLQRTDLFEKTLILRKIEGGRRREQQRMRWLDRITCSVELSLSKLRELLIYREVWHAGMGLQRVRHNWSTELNCWQY